MKKFVSQVITKAGKELLKEFQNNLNRHDIKYKSKQQLVTKSDLMAEKIILSAIRKKYPDHQILSEEAGLRASDSDYLWIVDPLDGTTNFSFKSPIFGVIIGLAYKGEMQLGAIYIPFNDKLFLAEKGKGATMNGKRIHISNQKTLNKSFLTYCHGSKNRDINRAVHLYAELKNNHSDLRQMGASSMELAWVAAGYTDAFFDPGALPWDVAAGALIIREAGGKVTDFEGKEWNLDSKDLLATNDKIHSTLLKKIKKYDL